LKDAPNVTVNPIRLDGNKISVLGKVARPGEYPINRPIDVMGALALGAGLNQFAAENSIKILRRNEQGEQIAIPFEYGDVKNGEALETNILLKAGDIVVVP
jgi:polysaccharide export outer membrane protein